METRTVEDVRIQDRLHVVQLKVGFLGEAVGDSLEAISDGARQGLAVFLREIENELGDILEPAKAKEA